MWICEEGNTEEAMESSCRCALISKAMMDKKRRGRVHEEICRRFVFFLSFSILELGLSGPGVRLWHGSGASGVAA